MLIGVTAGLIGEAKPRYVGLHDGYLRGLARAGAAAVVWPSTLGVGDPADVAARAKELVQSVAGIVLTGGGDVGPERYGESARTERLYGVEPARDELEIALVHAALDAGVALLAVCRGVQILNVALGGTLVQDLEEAGYRRHSVPEHEYDVAHVVLVEPDSVLASLVGTHYGVNSLHHQAVERPAEGARVVARSEDGVIEALEGRGFLAVQWHPERMLDSDERAQGLFEWLVAHGSRS